MNKYIQDVIEGGVLGDYIFPVIGEIRDGRATYDELRAALIVGIPKFTDKPEPRNEGFVHIADIVDAVLFTLYLKSLLKPLSSGEEVKIYNIVIPATEEYDGMEHLVDEMTELGESLDEL